MSCERVILRQKLSCTPDPHAVFAAFSKWIPNSPELYVDVVDYHHVAIGPQTVLTGFFHDVYIDRDINGTDSLVVKFHRGTDFSTHDGAARGKILFGSVRERLEQSLGKPLAHMGDVTLTVGIQLIRSENLKEVETLWKTV